MSITEFKFVLHQEYFNKTMLKQMYVICSELEGVALRKIPKCALARCWAQKIGRIPNKWQYR